MRSCRTPVKIKIPCRKNESLAVSESFPPQSCVKGSANRATPVLHRPINVARYGNDHAVQGVALRYAIQDHSAKSAYFAVHL